MPKKKSTSSKTPPKKSARAGKPSATQSRKKKTVSEKPHMTLSQGLCAPSVWAAHQALPESGDPRALLRYTQFISQWEGVHPKEEAWSSFIDFFRNLDLKDLQKSVTLSPMLMGHPLLLDQVLYFRELLRMDTIEKMQCVETEHLIYLHMIKSNPLLIATAVQSRARNVLEALLSWWVQTLIPTHEVVARLPLPKKRGAKEKVEWDITTSGEMIPIPVAFGIVADYQDHCKILTEIYKKHLNQIDEYARPKFWSPDVEQDEPGRTKEFTQRMRALLQDLSQASPYGKFVGEYQEANEEGKDKSGDQFVIGSFTEIKTKPFLPQTIRCRLWDLFEVIEKAQVSRPAKKKKLVKKEFIPLADEVVDDIIEKGRGGNTKTINPEDLLYAFLEYHLKEENRYQGEIDQYALDHALTEGAIQGIIDREKKKRNVPGLDISKNPALQAISLRYLLDRPGEI